MPRPVAPPPITAISQVLSLLIPILLTGFSKDKRCPYENYVALVSVHGF
jgi:hypothetical protein